MLTYFVVQSFQRTKRGILVAEPAIEARDEGHAVRMADRFAAAKDGVVAFRRSGDPSTGDYEDAVILYHAGDVVGLDEDLAIAS
jgi:hypothetical protein